MDDDNVDEDFLPPANAFIFSIPDEPNLKLIYELCKPSKGTTHLASERNREVFAEAFIENNRLGTLADLCIRALAKLGTRYLPPQVEQDRKKLRIFYESLSVNLPLKDCYFVEDTHFWRRVVLAKSSDTSLEYKKIDEYDWRGKGISLKYVELVESCPANYWPEKEMAELGAKIRPYVRTLDIKHLQSMPDYSFRHYIDSESELDATSEESEYCDISSDERDTMDEVEEECEEEEEIIIPVTKGKKGSHITISKHEIIPAKESFHIGAPSEISILKSKDHHSLWDEQIKRREARRTRNEARQQLRQLHLEKKLEHERRKKNRAILRMRPVPEKKPKKKKKVVEKPIDGVFNLPVEPEPEDMEDKIADKRNINKLLRRVKRYNYPSNHCHHIDLSFVRYFDMLNALSLEFLGPNKMERNYHNRHFNFSFDDMVRLGKGLRNLNKLKIFRLRNSRMDNMKLLILAKALKQLESLEVVDLGYDQIADNCSVALEMILERSNMLKALELEYNNLEEISLQSIGYTLNKYNKGPECSSLEYLGLAFNPISSYGLRCLIEDILGTEHVQELNIDGITTDPIVLAENVSYLVRNHKPLIRLNMAAVRLNPPGGRRIVCSLETNHKILHFECRGCNLTEEQEFEVDVIMRRNNYEYNHSYLGDETQTEESLRDIVHGLRHPILIKLQRENMRKAECLKNRVNKTPSISSEKEELLEENELEFDIWQTLGVNNSNVNELEIPKVANSDSDQDKPFVFNPNSFNEEEIREYLQMPGPTNRYYYLQSQKD